MRKIKTPPATLAFHFPHGVRGIKGESAFTLVELLVSISLAIALMVSISIFVTDGVKNITIQKNIISNDNKFLDFKNIISNNLSSINRYLTGFTNQTGALFKANKNYSAGGFTYIGEQNFTGTYCSGTENDSTKHLIIKNFIPFEKVDTDLFSGGYNYDDGIYKLSYFSGLILNGTSIFTGTYFGPSDLVFGTGNNMYVSDTLNHTILKFDKTNTNIAPQIVLGKASVFGYDYVSGSISTGTLLNNPTGLAFGDNTLFITDTLNDRILYVSSGFSYTLLDRYDGLREPTGIYYNAGTLYISNSAKGEILSYSGGGDNNLFTKGDNVLEILKSGLSYPTGINNLYFIDFLTRKKINIITSSETNLSQFDFSKIPYSKYSDYILDTPIKSFNFTYSSGLLNANIKYFKNYSCNDEKSNIERTYLIKKYIK